MPCNDPTTQPPNGQIAVVYDRFPVVDAADIAGGKGTIRGAALAIRDNPGIYLPADQLGRLVEIDGLPRLYPDGLLARTVEKRYGLPTGDQFDCLQTLARLPAGSTGCEDSYFGPHATVARAERCLQEYDIHVRVAAQQDLLDVYRGIELPIISVAAEMISDGLLLDVEGLEAFRATRQAAVDRATAEIRQASPRPVNPEFNLDVESLLFGDLGLPIMRRTRKGRASTGDRTLAGLAHQHPVIPPLAEHRKANRLLQRAGELLEAVHPATCRVHTRLDPLGATTGRFTSKKPCLQNLPRQVLPFVIAPEGTVLMEADFGQMEMRVLAMVSQEPRLLEAFEAGDVDLHRAAAAAALNLDPEAVTEQQRKIGKTMNFAIAYGQTAIGLSESLGVPVTEAQELIDSYFTSYPAVRRWIGRTHAWMHNRWSVRTMYGRQWILPHDYDPSTPLYQRMQRQAVNAAIQGTAADIMKLALARLHAALPADVRMVLTVHDSVLLEVPIDCVDEVGQHVRAIMETPPPGFTVPLRVEVSTGRTWAECKTHTTPAENDGEQAAQDHMSLEAASH